MADLIKIKFTTKGPNKNHRINEIVSVDKKRADLLIEEKHAKKINYLKGKKKKNASGKTKK